MELPHRKLTRLKKYDYGQDGSYFVTLCTHNRVPLFEMEPPVGNGLCAVPSDESTDNCTPYTTVQNQLLHKWLIEIKRKFSNIEIEKYVVMPDHLHLIITIKEQHTGCSLPDVMHFFKTMTTNEYIRFVKAGILPAFDKKIWQKSYYDHVIRDQQDYNKIWEYIENNPTKWMWIHDKNL